MSSIQTRFSKIRSLARHLDLDHTPQDGQDISSVKVENCTGFSRAPLAIAGPVRIRGPGVDGIFYAPLAIYEATLVASCSRGCKAFGNSGGVQFEVLGDGMSRVPVFTFEDPTHAIAFYQAVPSFQDEFATLVQSTSPCVYLRELRASINGSRVHVLCNYSCGDATGEGLVTKATNHACNMLIETYTDEFSIKGFSIEGQLASDKKASWGNMKASSSVQVLARGKVTPSACREVLGCSTERLHDLQKIGEDGRIRNGQLELNISTADIVAAMFRATGQDPASIAEASWCHLTSEFDRETGILTMSLLFPSLPVVTVEDGTGYATERDALSMLGCVGPDKKYALAGIIASFALALGLSTSAAVCNNTFSDDHV
ncbi:hmg- reductase [Fusarium albosuccineum]|uniref:Hmg- reductase n=1 Tax=Fusarium albosuccineum TaxID=1237068 RepID=A0A8H4KYA6_9HYPO|nr:hmg- reductase [Fusarium albosuccineum]